MQSTTVLGRLARLLVELAHRGGTGRRVDARKDVQDLVLAGKAAEGNVGKILADQHEGRRCLALLREAATELKRFATESYCACHVDSLSRLKWERSVEKRRLLSSVSLGHYYTS
jgi:hypothetical protein